MGASSGRTVLQTFLYGLRSLPVFALLSLCVLRVMGVPYTLYRDIGPLSPHLFGPSGERAVSVQDVHCHDYANGMLSQGRSALSRGKPDEAAHHFRAELNGPSYATKNFQDVIARAYLSKLARVKAENAKPGSKNAVWLDTDGTFRVVGETAQTTSTHLR